MIMWKNLAPNIIRQRLIIEGTTDKIVEPELMKQYLLALADVTKMEVLSGPEARSAHELGYGGWIHWRTSGTHFYSYPGNPALFTVDTYTCKPFSVPEVVEFTKKFFNAREIVWKEIAI